VVDLAALLTKMGAHIEGAGTSTIRIKGVEKLGGARHRIIPDRIEAATFLLAGALTGGDLMLTDCDPSHLTSLLTKLEEVGVKVRAGDATPRLWSPETSPPRSILAFPPMRRRST
jgi:UDP-N-acetylglucosamine 1-carboxyvinyltransferase